LNRKGAKDAKDFFEKSSLGELSVLSEAGGLKK
jgi:hypothetical protein